MSESKSPRRRSKNQYLPWLRLFVRLLIVVAVLVVGFLVWNNWDKIAPEAVLDWAEARFGDAQTGNGFPTAIEGNSVLAMSEVNQHLVALTDTSLQFYNSSASRVVTRNHPFSNPTLHTAGRYALITEVGGSRFRLETRRETVLSMELENRKIYASCLLSSGMVAVVTDSASQSYLCEIGVYDRRGKSVFTYQCRKYLLTNISLATNGKGIAAVGTTAEGGMLKSVLLMFNFSDTEPVEYSGSDLLLYDVNYYSSGAVLAVGDKEVWILPARGNAVDKISLDGFEPIGYSASTTLSALVLERSGSTGDGYVWTIDGSGTVWKSEQMEGNFRSVSCQNTQILALTESHLYNFSKSKLENEVHTPSDSLLVTEYRDRPLLLTLSELQRVES
ncbi:MAG: hypothetical protein IJN61_05845 [Clostridia bacterium]|nr:hypothetical protein [Clostridia bacterium]MBQ7038610.1 hypothetical protein [Clostridia bacterium]